MTECSNLTDRMPAVAHGLAVWEPADRAHLESCVSCRLEWDLVRAGAALGATPGSGLDTRRVAEVVARRLREAGPVGRIRGIGRIGRWVVTVAAAAAIILAVQLTRPERAGPVSADSAPAAGPVLQELDGLTATELQSLLESFSPAVEALPHVESAPLGELKPQELERVLRSLEG
jgi:hypothetical protein